MKKGWAAALALLIIAVGVFTYLYFFRGNTAPMLADEGPDSQIEEPMNYLIFGRDVSLDSEATDSSSKSQSVETDLVIIATFDAQAKAIDVTFIPPNAVVDGESQLKNLYDEKGITGLKAGVTELTNKEIDYYIGIDYQPFVQLVDVLDGIEVKMDETIDLEKYGLFIHPGINKLNGEETLKLLRLKWGKTTVVERIERQKIVLTAIYQRLSEVKNLSQMEDVSNAVLAIREKLATDVESEQILKLFDLYGKGIDKFTVDIFTPERESGN